MGKGELALTIGLGKLGFECWSEDCDVSGRYMLGEDETRAIDILGKGLLHDTRGMNRF